MIDYTVQVQKIEEIEEIEEASAPLGYVQMGADGTRIGAPITQLLRRVTAVALRMVILTAGEAGSQVGAFEWHVLKRDLLASLLVAMKTHRIGVHPTCPFSQDLKDELKSIQRTVSERRHDSYAAAGSGHEDMAMALYLAVWQTEKAAGTDAWHFATRRMVSRTPAEDVATAEAAQARMYPR